MRGPSSLMDGESRRLSNNGMQWGTQPGGKRETCRAPLLCPEQNTELFLDLHLGKELSPRFRSETGASGCPDRGGWRVVKTIYILGKLLHLPWWMLSRGLLLPGAINPEAFCIFLKTKQNKTATLPSSQWPGNQEPC